MTWQDLRAKYGGNSKMALRRAIRAEIKDGALVLDSLERWSAAVNLSDDNSALDKLEALERRRDEMVAEIQERYGITPKD